MIESNSHSSFKTFVMAKNYVQVEVLLVTGTSFLAGNWIKKDENPTGSHLSEMEELQEACWNGLLETMLPEVCIKPPNGGILYLWDVKEAKSFLELELSEVPLPIDRRLSITPHSFLCYQDYN
jgi:hypothetical protein